MTDYWARGIADELDGVVVNDVQTTPADVESGWKAYGG